MNNVTKSVFKEGGLRSKGIHKSSTAEAPLVTIITVVYNGESFLEKTIKSVIGQTYGNIEYIIIDGGSTDRTLEIIEKYEDNIDYWVSEKDKGIYDAMNKGIELSHGEWINFLNADDTMESDISKFSGSFKGDYSLIYGNVRILNTSRTQEFLVSNPNVKKEDFYNTTPMCHQAIFYSKKHIKKYDITYKILADRVMTYYVIEECDRIKYEHDFTVSYYENGMSMAFKNRIKAIAEEIRFLKRIQNIPFYKYLGYIVRIIFLLPLFEVVRKTKLLDLYRKIKYSK